MAKAQTRQVKTPRERFPSRITPVLPMQYDVRIHSIQFDGPCRATASLNINGCFAVRGVKVMESSKGLFVSMPGQINSKGEIKDICFPYLREARAELGIGCRDRLPAGTDAGDEPLSPVGAGPHGTAGPEDGHVTHRPHNNQQSNILRRNSL